MGKGRNRWRSFLSPPAVILDQNGPALTDTVMLLIGIQGASSQEVSQPSQPRNIPGAVLKRGTPAFSSAWLVYSTLGSLSLPPHECSGSPQVVIEIVHDREMVRGRYTKLYLAPLSCHCYCTRGCVRRARTHMCGDWDRSHQPWIRLCWELRSGLFAWCVYRKVASSLATSPQGEDRGSVL